MKKVTQKDEQIANPEEAQIGSIELPSQEGTDWNVPNQKKSMESCNMTMEHGTLSGVKRPMELYILFHAENDVLIAVERDLSLQRMVVLIIPVQILLS
jgi:hypothetical protein